MCSEIRGSSPIKLFLQGVVCSYTLERIRLSLLPRPKPWLGALPRIALLRFPHALLPRLVWALSHVSRRPNCRAPSLGSADRLRAPQARPYQPTNQLFVFGARLVTKEQCKLENLILRVCPVYNRAPNKGIRWGTQFSPSSIRNITGME